ncbi:MAG: sugar-binding domain-containing protein, partial [Chloroflexota bacterium]
HRFLPAPLFVETAAVAQSLLNERAIAETLSLARNVDIHLVGIGAIDSRLSGLYRTGYFNEQDMNAHRAAGAVGDLIGRFIGPEGQTLDIDANRCVIGLDLEALRQTSTVIGVAGGDVKAPAILAALKGQYLDVLITDAITATQVLDLHTDNQNIKYA